MILLEQPRLELMTESAHAIAPIEGKPKPSCCERCPKSPKGKSQLRNLGVVRESPKQYALGTGLGMDPGTDHPGSQPFAQPETGPQA
jgi:hypothetical protein